MEVLLYILIGAVTFGLLPASVVGAIDIGIGLMVVLIILGIIGWVILAFVGLGGLIFYIAILVTGLAYLLSLMLRKPEGE